jgi:glycosyltransferase involved in cell wall biosynthesis
VSPRISVFLPSHNKGGFAVEAARSVFDQDFEDWELWILENSTDDGRTRRLLQKFVDLGDPRVNYEEIELPSEIRANRAACAYINNQYYPRANGDIIFYVSDDDLFMPGVFRAVVAHLDENYGHDAVYFHLARTTARNPGEGKLWRERWAGIKADIPRDHNAVDCQIDGGQVAYRKHVLDAIGQPYFYEGLDSEGAHADGLHLKAVARAGFLFNPVNVQGVIHRHTPISTWTKS